MGDQGTNALAALILGSAVAVLLFIPVPRSSTAATVLWAGRTLGELVVDTRTPPAPCTRRLVKLLAGVVPLVLLAVVTTPAPQVLLVVLAVIAVAGAFLTADHRGTSNALAGLRLESTTPEASTPSTVGGGRNNGCRPGR